MAAILKVLLKIHNFLVPHYCVNFMLSSSYYVFKTAPPICEYLFESCVLEMRELELLMFLGCMVVVKNRRSSNVKDHFNTICMFSKVLSVLLYFNQHPLYALVYAALCLMHLVFLPEPGYEGPQYITYFNSQNIMTELEKDSRITWVIECYATWSPPCIKFADTFAKISAKYNHEFLKFGKIDVSRYQDIAQKFNISTSSWSKQLPTVILLRDAKEVDRRPAVDRKGSVTKYVFTEESIIQSLDLANLFLEASRRGKKKEASGEKSAQEKKKD